MISQSSENMTKDIFLKFDDELSPFIKEDDRFVPREQLLHTYVGMSGGGGGGGGGGGSHA